ncbi:MAG TPA: YciI family protein [Acidimicrobiales bacterium]|jgi:uncharacterized protein|nr:YciI family protein [Acidimicrobiales bacterium]
MKCVVLYTSADDVLPKAREHFPAHSEWFGKFVADGTLLMIGTFADAQADGSMAIFTDRAAAEAFVAGDPFVQHGVVLRYELKDWNG